jgi:hypothetical protein
MKDLIDEINSDVLKCNISYTRITTTDLQKEYLQGMIDAYNRTIYRIELNYSDKTYEEIHEENVKKWRNKK